MKRLCVICFIFTFTLKNIASELTETDVGYYVVTKNNSSQLIKVNSTDLSNYLDKSADIVFFIHGYLENYQAKYYGVFKNALFKRPNKNYNIVEVDWSKSTRTILFLSAARDARLLGKIIGDIIIKLVSQGFSTSNFELIGFSLGAQVAGIAGRTVSQSLGVKIKRITAIEPASVAFVLTPANIKKTDAELVVALHTDSGKFGQPGPNGHIDIYFNTGYAFQPGCPQLGDADTWLFKIINFFFCSHLRAPMFYGEALTNPGTMLGVQCPNYFSYRILNSCKENKQIDIGSDELNLNDGGIYYLSTNSKPPYAKLS